jgi:hypothetical protein
MKHKSVARALVSDVPELAAMVPAFGPILDFVLSEFPPIRDARVNRMLGDLLSCLGKDPGELVEILRGSQEFVDLIASTMNAASQTRSDERLKLIAEEAARGIEGGSPEKIDLARLRIATIADLDSIHVAVLRRIAASQPVEVSLSSIRGALGNQQGLEAVTATLVRHGLVREVDALVGFAGPNYRLTDYGVYLLDQLVRGKV